MLGVFFLVCAVFAGVLTHLKKTPDFCFVSRIHYSSILLSLARTDYHLEMLILKQIISTLVYDQARKSMCLKNSCGVGWRVVTTRKSRIFLEIKKDTCTFCENHIYVGKKKKKDKCFPAS